jgi:putative membrane protein
MASIEEIFTAETEAAIRRAVEEAESGTAGEIVPFVVAASDTYEGALWKGAALGALTVPLVAAGVWLVFEPWGPGLPFWLAVPSLVGAALGYLVSGAVPALRRALIGAVVLDLRVRRRASVAFLEEEVFRTRDRTGILIFLSLFERRVVVIGDEGINQKVEPGEWKDLVDRLTVGIRAGRSAEALVAALEECGKLLRRKGVEIRPDDTDELDNALRRREE